MDTKGQADTVMVRSEGHGYGTIAKSLGMSKSMVVRIVKRFEVVVNK